MFNWLRRNEVRETLAELCKDKRSDDYVFVSPKDSDERQREVKKGFHTACRLAGIEGLIWKDLRATFGTRLAETGCDAFTIVDGDNASKRPRTDS